MPLLPSAATKRTKAYGIGIVMRQQPSPSRGGFGRGVGNQDSPRRGTGSVNLTKIFAEGGFPPKQIKPRPFEKGRGLEKRLKPLLTVRRGWG